MSEATQQPQEGTEELDAGLVAATIAGLTARGEAARRYGCMELPAPVFNELLTRLLDRAQETGKTIEWLAAECGARSIDAPSRSSVYRFAAIVREEYRLAQLAARRQTAEAYVKGLSGGDPDAMQMALNARVTELLTDELMRADDGGQIETKRLMAVLAGARMVAQTAFDKQKMDARIKALETAIENTRKAMELKDQKLRQLPEKIKAIEDKLAQAETATAQGKKVDPRIYATMRAELVAMAKLAAQPAAPAAAATAEVRP